MFCALPNVKISGERLQDQWSSGFNFRLITAKFSGVRKFRNFTVHWLSTVYKDSLHCADGSYRKVPKFLDARNFCCNHLKI